MCNNGVKLCGLVYSFEIVVFGFDAYMYREYCHLHVYIYIESETSPNVWRAVI